MPDLTLSEADRCPHCGEITGNSPTCCAEAYDYYSQEHEAEFNCAELGGEAGGA